MYVFRDGRRTVGGAELILGLKGALLRWRSAPPGRTPKTACWRR